MKILNFNEYISEGLWSKGVNRAKTGKERLEDITSDIEKCVEFLGKLIAGKEGIQYSSKLCTYEQLPRKSWYDYDEYLVKCDVSKKFLQYSPLIFKFIVKDDFNDMVHSFMNFHNGFNDMKHKIDDKDDESKELFKFVCSIFMILHDRLDNECCNMGKFHSSIKKPEEVDYKKLFNTSNIK